MTAATHDSETSSKRVPVGDAHKPRHWTVIISGTGCLHLQKNTSRSKLSTSAGFTLTKADLSNNRGKKSKEQRWLMIKWQVRLSSSHIYVWSFTYNDFTQETGLQSSWLTGSKVHMFLYSLCFLFYNGFAGLLQISSEKETFYLAAGPRLNRDWIKVCSPLWGSLVRQAVLAAESRLRVRSHQVSQLKAGPNLVIQFGDSPRSLCFRLTSRNYSI